MLTIYFDGGLSDLAKCSGYLPNSVGSNFKRVHHFLLETWEAIYRQRHGRQFTDIPIVKEQTPHDILEYIVQWIKDFPKAQMKQNTLGKLNEYRKHLSDYVEQCANESLTCTFWAQFVFQDCFTYIALYLVMRSGKWCLRMAAIKSMASLFTAFDWARYQKLVGQHILDTLLFPDEVLHHLCDGDSQLASQEELTILLA